MITLFKSSLLILACVIGSSLLTAADLSELKLQGRWPVGAIAPNALQGYAVALSDKWAISGAPYAQPGTAVEEGVVHVFSTTTGAWVRMLRRPASEVGKKHFGQALAISGDLAVICDDGNVVNGTGAYVYNLATGALVRKLKPSYDNSGVSFGSCVSVSGKRVVIGAPDDGSGDGSVYLFDLTTGIEQAEFFPSDAASSPLMKFGTSVAIDGNLALIGAPAHGGARGAAYLFDLTTLAEVCIIVPADSVANDKVGFSVALNQGVAAMAAPYFGGTKGAVFTHDLRTLAETTLTRNTAGDYFGYSTPGSGVVINNGMIIVAAPYASANNGAVFVYDLRTKQLLRSLMPTDGTDASLFGGALAMSGNSLLVGRTSDASPVSNVGSAYLIKPLTTVMPVSKVAARYDFAPGAPEAAFSVLGDAFINSDAEVAFGAKLSGPGSHGNTDTGIWTTMRTGGTLSLSAMSYFTDKNYVELSVGVPIINSDSTAPYRVTYKTGVGGITALNNKAIYAENGVDSSLEVQTGDPVAVFGSTKFNGVTELVQSTGANGDRYAFTCALRQEAITSTNATNDSGVVVQDMTGPSEGVREGALIKPANTVNYGQFTGRVAYLRDSLIYSAATTDVVTKNAVIMQKSFGVNETVVATKGLPAPTLGGPLFSAFIGEVADYYNRVTYRATLTGSGVTTANNEGLWTHTTGNVNAIAMRKGVNAKLLGGLTIAKFIQFWAVSGITDEVIALVQLGGTGVNSANDQALIMVQGDDSWLILMREGQPAPGCHPATVGVISRVEMDPYNGYYAVLTTLKGAAPGTDQALVTGRLIAGNVGLKATLRRPSLFLRKGALYDNQPSKIKSMSLPLSNITVSGAGGTGRGRAVSNSANIVITVEFDNGVRQIMKGNL